jgi:hypothetical protein
MVQSVETMEYLHTCGANIHYIARQPRSARPSVAHLEGMSLFSLYDDAA